jgi:hypothetical protein
MTRDGPATLAQDLAQRESDHQRWDDDGGHPTDSLPATPTARTVHDRSARPKTDVTSTDISRAPIPTP